MAKATSLATAKQTTKDPPPQSADQGKYFCSGLFLRWQEREDLVAADAHVLETHGSQPYGVEQILGVDDHWTLE